jgi:hypothetical protein
LKFYFDDGPIKKAYGNKKKDFCCFIFVILGELFWWQFGVLFVIFGDFLG